MSSKIGVSTWSLQQATYQKGINIYDMIELISSMGVEGLDYYGEYIPCYPGVDLNELHRIKKKCVECGLPITSTWFMCDIAASIAASSMQTVVEETKRYLAVTAECGAEFMTYPFLFNVPGLSLEQHYETLLRFFEAVLPQAEEYGVRFAHECARQNGPAMSLRLKKALGNDFYTICPDLEAWRLETLDIPLVHAETAADIVSTPEPVSLFTECLPYSPLVHFKLLSLDENGEEPHFPIRELMQAINDSPVLHHLDIEYEGWIPDLHPDRDCIHETKRCVELIRRYQNNASGGY